MMVDENDGSCEFMIRTGSLPVCTHDCDGCMFYNDPELLDIPKDETTTEGEGELNGN